MGKYFHEFYIQPLNDVFFEALAMYLIWTVFIVFFNDRVRRFIAIPAAIFSLAIILRLTLFMRTSPYHGEMILTPFQSFEEAKVQPEFYRTMFMNVVMFLPLGLSLPFVLRGKMSRRALFGVLILFGLSVSIELSQFVFVLGRCETDDVIMNTLGGAIGVTSFLICEKIREFFSAHEHKNHSDINRGSDSDE